MHTLLDVVERIVRSPVRLSDSTGLPEQLTRRAKLLVPGDASLLLPVDREALLRLPAPQLPDDRSEPAQVAQAVLLSLPGAVFPLPVPSEDQLRELGEETARYRSERPRRLGLCVAIELLDSTTLYGAGEAIFIENGIRMGSTSVVSLQDQWTMNLDEIEDVVLSYALQAPSSVKIAAEENRERWRKIAILIGGPSKKADLPRSWQRQLRVAAGLHRVELDIRPNPDSSRAEVLHDLRTKNYDGLFVWADWVSSPDMYVQPFIAAHPTAWAEVFGSPVQPMSFDEHVLELSMHLRVMVPVFDAPAVEPDSTQSQCTWEEVHVRIVEMSAGAHIAFTERAISMIRRGPYPSPGRMLQHLEALESLAAAYSSKGGVLGGRLADVAISDYGIEVARRDKSSTFPEFQFDGRVFVAEDHVKVDDAKSLDKTGRIYFAIDKEGLRFIVDHVGVHDYG